MEAELAENVGEHFLVGISGPRISDTEKKLLKKLKPAGVMLLAGNFSQHKSYQEWLTDYKRLISDFKDASEREKIITALDHEGGRVIRTPAPTTCFPYPIYWKDKFSKVAEAIAVELDSLGINLNLAPLCDIHTNPANPVIGPRAYGDTPEKVAACATAFAGEMKKRDILCCAKHFPGHGDTTLDSHLALPSVDKNWEELLGVEIVPFAAMIKKGVPAIMTAHILYPKIDPENPATLSRLLLTEKLNDELGFDGIVISDSIMMEAVSGRFNKPDGIVRAVTAGCDLFIVCASKDGSDLEAACRAASFLAEACRTNNGFREGLTLSRSKINAFLSRLKTPDIKELPHDTLISHQNLADSICCNPGEVERIYGVSAFPPHRDGAFKG